MPSDWIEPALALFRAACALPDGERAAYLDRVCGEDVELRRHVEGMLAADAGEPAPGDGAGRHPVGAALSDLVRRAADAPAGAASVPATIGGYRILGLIARGGMGVVYEAQQEQPRRRVAIKVADAFGTTGERARRFELEAQLLARLRHPGIARIIEAGTTSPDAGARPYFVMELVEGQPLIDHARAHLRTAREKVELMVRVCEPVGFAHREGVIHRDLKPDNVLIEADGAPKVLAFGVAKVEAAGGFGAATMRTEAGRIIGTLGYMAPEQFGGKTTGLGPEADVYSLGAMLYQLLSDRLPHELDEVSLTQALAVVTTADAPRLGVIRPEYRGDIEAVVAKALEKDGRDRYPDAAALQADLERYLRDEPVLARRHSALRRARKFSRRHRGLVGGGVATIAALLLGLVTSLTLLGRFHGKVREFEQLAAEVQYETAIEGERELYPPWPDKADAMRRWLVEDCGKPLARRDEIDRTLRELRSRALPWTEADRERDLRSHPRRADWRKLGNRLQALRYAQSIRSGAAELAVPELTAAQNALPVLELYRLGWARVAPDRGAPEWWRSVYGEEALGLACAREAVARSPGPFGWLLLSALAWAQFANGQDDDARRHIAAAVAVTPAGYRADAETSQRLLLDEIDHASRHLATAEAEYAALTAEVTARRTWRFADEAPQFLHDTLSDLFGKLPDLAKRQEQVLRRLSWAERIEQLTLAHPDARVRWQEARTAIRAADGRVASALYREHPIDLQPQMGLVPIGMNPRTKLWEFYELHSAYDGRSDPASIAIPRHAPDGSIEVTGETGIVFVLLPGGTSLLGATPQAGGPNPDPLATPNEMVHDLTLAPFFLARHELTQGQWARLWTWDEDQRHPSYYRAGLRGDWGSSTLAHPVEQVQWVTCDSVLTQHGLALPTEGQWEYACRAGTPTPWSCDPAELKEHANLADRTAAAGGAPFGPVEDWTDGHGMHAPVGSYRANPFGLHDVHGNVWEWCRDWYTAYGSERPGDGLRQDTRHTAQRIARGGSFKENRADARSSRRVFYAPVYCANNIGLRPARELRLR